MGIHQTMFHKPAAASGGGGGEGVPNIIFRDTFTGSAGNLGAHSPETGGYTSVSPATYAQLDGLGNLVATNVDLAFVETDVLIPDDVITVELKVTFPSTTPYTTERNYLGFSVDGSYNNYVEGVLEDEVDGNYALVRLGGPFGSNGFYVVSAGVEVTLKWVYYFDDRVELYINDVLSATSGAFSFTPGTYFSFYIERETTAANRPKFSELTVWSG